MKHRNGFVANSSSASFVVRKADIAPLEIAALLAYNLSEENTDWWSIRESGDRIVGSTNMDNDALDDYLERIGFPVEKMTWNDNS